MYACPLSDRSVEAVSCCMKRHMGDQGHSIFGIKGVLIVAELLKRFFDQFKLPEGFWGHIAGKMMAASNRELNAVKPVMAVCVTAISNHSVGPN